MHRLQRVGRACQQSGRATRSAGGCTCGHTVESRRGRHVWMFLEEPRLAKTVVLRPGRLVVGEDEVHGRQMESVVSDQLAEGHPSEWAIKLLRDAMAPLRRVPVGTFPRSCLSPSLAFQLDAHFFCESLHVVRRALEKLPRSLHMAVNGQVGLHAGPPLGQDC